MNIRIEPLTREAFAPFGDVIDSDAVAKHYTINDGYAERYHDLARIDVAEANGRPLLNIFRAKARLLPMRIALIERHPLSSQAFIPLQPGSFLVLVARAGDAPRPSDLRCFRSAGSQGVNYARGTWHHPLIALEDSQDFLVVDRGGAGDNCDEIAYGEELYVTD